MKTIPFIAAMLSVAGAAFVGPAVHAQGYTPIYTLDFGNPTVLNGDATMTGARRKVGLALGVFPIVSFLRSGFFPEANNSGTNNISGRLVALDASFALATGTKGSGPALDVGGWYFVEGGGFSTKKDDQYGRIERADLYEVHGRIFNSLRREVGLQGGVIGSTNRAARDARQYTLFAVSEYSSARLRRRNRTPWAVQGGIGTFIDPNYDSSAGEKRTTYGPTFFVSGSVGLSKRFSLTVSEWYVRNRRQDINRVGAGIGYNF